MYARFFLVTAAWTAVCVTVGAQTFERKAVFTGGGKPGEASAPSKWWWTPRRMSRFAETGGRVKLFV